MVLTVMKIDGEKLKETRERAFLSKGELAERAGLDRNTVGRVEKAGLTDVHPRTIRKLAEALSADPASLAPKD